MNMQTSTETLQPIKFDRPDDPHLDWPSSRPPAENVPADITSGEVTLVVIGAIAWAVLVFSVIGLYMGWWMP